MRRGLAALALVTAGCGADLVSGDDDPWPDSGQGGDGGVVCRIGIRFDSEPPVTGGPVYVTATSSSGGPTVYSWSVEFEGESLPVTAISDNGSRVFFEAVDPGSYRITVADELDECIGFDEVVTIQDPNATDVRWRIRFVPPPGSAAPPQEEIKYIPSGADYDYSPTLTSGVAVDGQVVDGDGAPLAAYLRFIPAASPELQLHAFAGLGGDFAATLLTQPHDLLVIPFDDQLAPLRIPQWSPQPEPTITVDAGSPITGTVLDPAGDPLQGASVTVRVAGAPSSIDSTDAAGAFLVRGRPVANALVVVDVVPPDDTGLPRLTSAPAQLGAPGIVVRYAPELIRRDVGGTDVAQGGAAAPLATVTFVGTVGAAGIVSQGVTQAPASGRFAITVAADGAGALGAALVPAVPVEVVVDAGDPRPGIVPIDLTDGVPPAIDAPAPATVTGRVVDAGGVDPVGGADVRAIPVGALAAVELGQLHTAAAADGTFTLPAAAGASYQLVIVDRTGAHALRRSDLLVTGSTPLGDLALPDGLRLRGQVRVGASDLPGVAISIFPEDGLHPSAEAVTNASGTYATTLYDPGLPE